ncbi:hypothetical protein [uncultured Arsenicicoccus sp.]|uniref:hypothetical protein n=1 Tax=uncultured Arsenicicoccus sp. TaxID=491339 RepID=UPI0025979E2B|nr:hypothetical protein [uncultured Arsenicicoccus sp.]
MAFVVRDRSLPWLVVIGGLSNLGLTGYGALLVLYLVRDLGLTTDMVGWYFTTGAIGGVIGSVIAVPLASRVGTGRLHTAVRLACRSRGVLAGWLGSTLVVRPTIPAMAGLHVVACRLVVASPLVRLRELPARERTTV